MSLSGKVCIVTGASRGIGKGIALQLGEHGATVYITGSYRPKQVYAVVSPLRLSLSMLHFISVHYLEFH